MRKGLVIKHARIECDVSNQFAKHTIYFPKNYILKLHNRIQMFNITPSSFWELCFRGKMVRQRQTKMLPKTQTNKG
uniref:Uncharacterized protein n=1 Tax=Populus trichocarpa TaxID=3694 RepID=A0A2K1ZKA5_POPTR